MLNGGKHLEENKNKSRQQQDIVKKAQVSKPGGPDSLQHSEMMSGSLVGDCRQQLPRRISGSVSDKWG